METFRFDQDIAATPIDDRSAAVTVDPEWNVDGRILNGGYLQALVVNGARTLLPGGNGEGVPIAVSTSFFRPAAPGAGVVAIDAVRVGSTVTSITASLRQAGEVVVAGMVTFTSRTAPAGLAVEAGNDAAVSSYLPMPAVTPAEKSIRLPAHQLPGPPGLATLVDYAFVPEDSRWLSGDTTGGPHIRCWLEFADRRPADALAAIAMVDMAPPVCFAQGNVGWAPTLQLQVGLFAEPAPGPLLLDVAGSPYDGPVVAEDGLLWDSTGRLVARSRQIALAVRL